MVERIEQTITQKTDKPNSFQFRYGASGTDIKLYFDTGEDLENQLILLNEKLNTMKIVIDNIKIKLGNKDE